MFERRRFQQSIDELAEHDDVGFRVVALTDEGDLRLPGRSSFEERRIEGEIR